MKKFFITGSLVLFSISAFAQNFEELNKQVTALNVEGKYEKAIPLAQQAIDAAQKEYGETHLNYGASLITLGILYINTSRYDKAEVQYLKAGPVMKKAVGETHPDYAAYLSNLATLYQNLAKYDTSELLYLQAIEIWKNAPEKYYPKYAKGLNSLAVLYERMGKYVKAESYYLQAIGLQEKSVGKEDPEYARTVENLAILYNRMGQYEKAEPLQLQVIELRKKILGENHPDYIKSLHNLGGLYLSMNLFEKSEALFVQTMEMTKKLMGEEHYDYAKSLSDLGVLYAITEQFEKAIPLIVQTLAIVKKLLGENHPDYATNLSNLAEVYSNMGQYDKAATFFAQVVEIRRKVIGENHPYFASNLHNLANLYVLTKEYEKAETFYIQAKTIRAKTLGENHPDYLSTSYSLAEAYRRMGKYENAETLLLTATGTSLTNIRRTFTILSEKEKQNYIKSNIFLIETDNSFLYNHRQASRQMRINNYDLQLFFKSLSLSDTKNLISYIRTNEDTVIQKLFTGWQADKKLLARQYMLPATKRLRNMDSLEKKAENTEKELARKSIEFQKQQTALQITISNLLGTLQEDEAAIEYVSFRLQTERKTDSLVYAAYLLRKNDPIPIYVPLFEERELQNILDSTEKTVFGKVNQLYRGVEIKSRSTSALGEKVYKLIWSPLEPYLKGIRKVYYSPSGKLYGLAFHALPVDSSTILMDKYRLQQLTSTREIFLQQGMARASASDIILFGNPDFSMDSLKLVKKRGNSRIDSTLSLALTFPALRGGANSIWPPLPGTATEVKKIQRLFENEKVPVISYSKENASEENLKALSGHSPKILHIATHGFFLKEPVKEKKGSGDANTFRSADDALLRSGLVFSGANHTWSGKTPVDGMEDGIVTAYEISQLNLNNTELVVLSACETALGDIKGSEGVFGLQRAFKMAGVKKMILSLWQVPDKETAELMTTFYSYWLKGKTIEDAFAQAQTDMRKKYSPFYWAAFVLLE